MSCSNCFNGCTEITSDKCVKYTGTAIPELGIQTGDTLEFVEQALANFLISALDGSGIKPIVDLQGVCSIVADNIPACVGCSGPTLNDLLQALIDSACDLQALITSVSNSLEVLEGPYNEGCLTVTESTFSNTHNVLQAVITKLCALEVDLDALTVEVATLPTSADVVNIVADYLADTGIVGGAVKYYTRMVPYVALPWFAPDISGKFDGTGKGLDAGEYQYIYLCNGANGTPDLRGRVLAGITDGTMLGGPMSAAVNPATVGNPNYSLNTTSGVNFVTLSEPEIPNHTHTISINDPGHTHFVVNSTSGNTGDPNLTTTNSVQVTNGGGGNSFPSYLLTGSVNPPTIGLSEEKETGITATASTYGQTQSHTNTQPTIGCYYIMYIP